MNIFILIFLMMLVTYIPRTIPAFLVDKIKPSKRFKKFLELIPYAAMTALIFPAILSVDTARPYIGIIGGVAAILLSLIKKMPTALVVVAAVAVEMLIYAII